MSDEASQIAQEVLDLERELVQLWSRVGAMERHRVAATEQQLAAQWMVGDFGQALTTIEGNVVDPCLGSLLPGSQVHVKGHTTGRDYGTFNATSGTYSVALALDSSDTSLDVSAIGPGFRFAESSASTLAVTAGTINTLANLTAAAATGYHCTTLWSYPVAGTLTLVDSLYGTRSIAWASSPPDSVLGSHWWVAPSSVTTPASASCPSVTVGLGYGMKGSGTLSTWAFDRFQLFTTGGCPTPTAGYGIEPVSGTATINSAPTATAKMDVTWPGGAGGAGTLSSQMYGGNSFSVRIYEP